MKVIPVRRTVRMPLVGLILSCFSLIYPGFSPLPAQILPFRNYTVDNGLASNRVLSVMQDSSGFMWFGTLNGISKFDGHQFISFFNHKSMDPQKGAYRMLQDRRGRLWFCVNEGLACLENQQWRIFTTSDGLTADYGRVLYEDRRGWIWFGTDQGVNCYDNRNWRIHTVSEGLADNGVKAFLETASGDLIGFSQHGLSVFDTLQLNWRRWLVEDSLGIEKIHAIKLDLRGNLWLGTDDGLRVYDGRKWKAFTPSNSPVPRTVGVMFAGSEGHMWLGGRNKVYEYNGQNWRVYSLDEQKTHILHPVHQDESGRLWISDKSDRGAYILEDGRFKRMDRNSGMLEGAIWDIEGDRDGNVWFAVYNQGVSLLPRSPFTIFRGEQYQGGNMVFDCLIDSRQNIWIGTDLWLSRFDGTRWKAYRTEDGVPGPLVFSLAEDSSGGIWCGTDSGAVRFDGKKWSRALPGYNLPRQSVKTILTDRHGVVWIGGDKGLTRYDGSSSRSYSTEDGLPGNEITSICETPSGNLWFGTLDGAARFDGRRFERFDKTQGLVSDHISDIFADSLGNIWIATDDGVCRFDGRRIDTLTTADGMSSSNCYFINRIGREMYFGTVLGLNSYDGKQFKLFSQEEGLAGNDLNRGASAVDSKGGLWFGSTEGLTVFDPSIKPLNADRPRVHITRASLIGPDSSFSEGAVLKHFENDLRFDFACLDFVSPERVVYSYRLDDADGKWKETRLNSVNLINLPPGSHVFEVLARNGRGLESPSPARFVFTIRPALYQTFAFKLFLILTLTAFILLLVRYWHKRKTNRELREKNKQLEREIAERERIGNELRESEQHLSDIVDFLPDATFAIDLEGKVILWNRAMEEMTGVRAEDILLKGNYEYSLPFYGIRRPLMVDLVLKWDDEIALKYQHVRIEPGNVILAEIEATMLGKDVTLFGKAKPLSSTKGEIIGAIESIRDISGRKQAEKKLQEERQRLAAIIEATNIGTWEFNVQTGEMVCNERLAEIAGYKLEEVSPLSIKTWERFTHPDDVRNTYNVLQKHLSGESDYYEVEYRMQHKDGHWVWVLDRGKVTTWTDDGKPLLMQGTHTDITSRKQAEIKLQEERQRLAAIIGATNVGTWEWNVQTGETVFNERWADIFGYKLEEVSPVSIKTWERFTHPEDIKATASILEKHFRGETDYYEAEFRMKHKDGHWVWVLDRGKVTTWTEDGKPLLMQGTHTDITERKRVEDAILEKAALLEAQVDATIDGILVVDENNRRLLINQRMIELFDVPQHCLDNEDDSALLQYVAGTAKHRDEFLAKVAYLYEHKNETSRDEIEFQNGMRLDRYSAPVLGQEGKHYGRIWTFRDITESKRAEEALLKRLAYEHLLSQISALAVKVDDLQAFQNECLALMGSALGISRAYIFEHGPEPSIYDNTLEWCGSGVEPQITNLQNVPVSAWFLDSLTSGGNICFSDIESIPDEWSKQALRPQRILSILVVPLFVGGSFHGFMGFDECNCHRQWPEEDVSLLTAISRIISKAIEQKRAEEALLKRMSYEHLLSQISALAVKVDDLQAFQNECLALMGSELGISRAYIFEHHPETNTVDNTLEWCCAGVSPQKDNMQGIPSDISPWWLETMLSGKNILFSDIEDIPEDVARDGLRAQDILSILVVPLFVGGAYHGFMGFDECNCHRHWPEEDVSLLTAISRIISRAIEQKRAEESLLKRMVYERLLSRISSSAVNVDDLQTFLQECMALIGETTGASRAYLFEHHPATDASNNIVKWYSEGIPSQNELLQNIPDSTSPWALEALKSGGSISYSDIEDIPDDSLREFLRSYGTRSLLVVPLFVGGDYYGFMGFDECQRKRDWPDEDVELLFSISRIITGAVERKQSSMEIMANMQRTEALLQLGKMTGATLKEITDFALEKAIEITQSEIGYLAFVNEDESELTINSWSKTALEKCAVDDKPIIYSVANTGLWGEAVRQRRPVITNDYSAENPWKKGLPEGHVHLLRHMNTPVFENNRIVVVAGVGNKEDEYTENDCRQLTLLIQGMWHLIERKRTEDALKLTQFATDKAYEHILWGDAYGNIVYANDSACESLGYTRDEILKMKVHEIDPDFSPEDLEKHTDDLARLGSITFESRHRTKDGRIFPVEINANYCDNNGQWMSCSFDRDISERKRAEQQLRESEEKFRLISEQSLMAIFILQDDRVRYANQAAADQAGYTVEELLKLEPGELMLTIHPDDRRFVQDQESRKQSGREGAIAHYFFKGLKKNGEILWLDQYSRTILYEGRTADLIVRADITEMKNAERALRESEERFRMIIEASKDGMIAINKQGLITIFNPAAEKIFGRESREMLDRPLDFLMPEPVRQDHRQYVEGFFNRSEPESGIDTTLQLKALHGDGTEFDIELSLSRGVADGEEFVLAVIRDITDKLALEATLLQSRKMETIGQLAGGVAHDFNNMLSVIIGHAEVALAQVDPEQKLHFVLKEILTAAERSADLTRQLLAFARKQTISPKVLDLNKTVAGTLGMLRRLIGEAVELNWLPAADILPVRMDPTQIDQVLTNLCINARDAIAGVGKIGISTGTIVVDEDDCAGNPGFLPGSYVLLTVSDNGRGMDRETLDRVFEPFFTTKERGKGTGLGLATVYGIVKQNEGFINVYSEPGQGTAFKIYLPVYNEPEGQESNGETVQCKAAGGSETVLLVEDEPSILVMAAAMLERQGYRVLSASSPKEAVRLAGEYEGKIDLLLTDVVMPEMNGRDLAKELLTICPDIRQLFMSGYTADVIAHHGVLEDGVHFLQKPFTARTLLENVRQALDSL